MQQNHFQHGRQIPLPPPPPHPSQTSLGVTLPPPPPRTAYQQNHGMVLPGPPSAVASTPVSYWARQQYPPPPMAPSTPVTYNPGAYQSTYGHNASMGVQHAQQHQARAQEQAPLVSATYIPGSDSFGPGVGIPPLYTPTEDHMGFFNDNDTYSTTTETSRDTRTNTISDDSGYYDSRNTSSRDIIIQSRGSQGYMSPGPPTATLNNPQHPFGSQDGQSGRTPLSPSDPASQWTLDRVITWLKNEQFSTEWQAAFKSLNIQGPQFLDLGRSGGPKGGVVLINQVIIPQVGRECVANGVARDQAKEKEEGKKLRKLVKRVLENGGQFSLSAGGHRRDTSLHSAGADGDLDTSPLLQQNGSTPTTAGTGDESPGRYLPPTTNSPASALSKRRTSQNRTASVSTPNDYNLDTGRSTYAEQMLRGTGDGFVKRHSPSPSRGEEAGTYFRQRHASPQHSPGTQSAHPATSESTNGRHQSSGRTSGHYRTNSAELNRRNGIESPRPSPMEYRQSSNEVPTSAKEHKGPFWKFSRRKRDDQADDSGMGVESPTSPVAHRTLMSGMPFAKTGHNASQTSLQSGNPLSGGVALHSTNSLGQSEPRKYAFVTPDGFTYRLVDITGADSPLALKQLVCGAFGVTYTPDISLHVTAPGQEIHDESLSDDLLMHARRSLADPLATLKLFIRVPPSSLSLDLQNGMTSPYKASFSGKALDEATESRIRGNSNPLSPSLRSDSDPTSGVSEVERMMQLSHAAELHRQETERKQQAYLEERRRHLNKASPIDTPGIRGDREIDFDQRRKTPYEPRDHLVPLRPPPAVPPDTSTLIKANSLTKKGGQKIRQGWLDEEKRRSGEQRPGSSGTTLQSSPLRRGETNRQRATADSQTYDPNGGESGESTLTQTKASKISRTASGGKPALTLQTSISSPAVPKVKSGPDFSDPNTRRQLERMVSKRGPTHDFEEANVTFSNRNPGTNLNDSGDDSDDGLFAVQIRKTNTDTRSITSPRSSQSRTQSNGVQSEVSADFSSRVGPTETTYEPQSSSVASRNASAGSPGAEVRDKDFDGGYEPEPRIPYSAASAGWSPEEPSRFNRRESFVSDMWANRPPAEALVEHLDEFFPNVNLDQPVLPEDDLGTIASQNAYHGSSGLADKRNVNGLSSVDEDSDGLGSLRRGGDSIASMAQRNMRKAGGLDRTKSIREVVKDAYQQPDPVRNSYVGPARVATLRQSAAGSIVRRKSTKMFGAKIEQVKPPRGSRYINLETIPQDTLPVLQKQPTFKWMKGQLIGKGTFGRVYLGMNMTTGELIAVKQVEVHHKERGQDQEKLKEMVRSLDIEIDTMKDLDHPNIVSYLGCERKEFSISIFLEYISGGSVGSCLRKHGKFEESVVSSLTRQTLSALAYLHREGILHRDLKADNILLDLDGTCKISDFGISKKTDDIYGNDVTNSMQGSVFWMAPEVIRSQGQGYSAKVDIWSLGCVVLEMFAGRRPWSKEEAIGAIYKLGSLNEAPPIPDDVSETAGPGAISFMYDCFTIDPADRPTAETLLRAPFCFLDTRYNFLDTQLYAKIKGAFAKAPAV